MKRLEINRFGEMETFVKVVELGGFSAAARQSRKSPSAVSKLMTRLEERLNARLIKRTTRGFQMTEEGQAFYQQSVRILSELAEAEQAVSVTQIPTGRLRITTNVAVGYFFLLPLVPEFLKLYPKISLDITITDKVIDLMGESIDVAIRAGPLKSSSLRSRKLGEIQLLIVGSPAYFKKYGVPKVPSDLLSHNLLRFNFPRIKEEWSFIKSGKKIVIKPSGNIEVSDGEAMRRLVLNGVGLARLADFHVNNDIASNQLIPILKKYYSEENEHLYAVFLGQGGVVPARIRTFIDFLVEKINL